MAPIAGGTGESSITVAAVCLPESIAAPYTVRGLIEEPVGLKKLLESALLYDLAG